jgi:DNA (cytosine-5)-methyltransferase 1
LPNARARLDYRIAVLWHSTGGLKLGLEWAGLGPVKWQVEIDPFCRKVLAKHWPNVTRYEDIRNVGKHNLEPVDLICGGFPCQDISYAGKGAGLSGERSGLWYEYARIIGEMEPRYVVVENVAALLNRGMREVLGTLASLGYDAEWDVISASQLGAPHQRERVWIIAYPFQRMWKGGRLSNKINVEKLVCGWQAEEVSSLVCCLRDDCITNRRSLRSDDGFQEAIHRIECLGNAVVPQVAQVIGEMIKQFEETDGRNHVSAG